MRFIAAISLALILVIALQSSADAKKWKQIKKPDRVVVLTKKEMRSLQSDLSALRRELDDFRKLIRPEAEASAVTIKPKDDSRIPSAIDLAPPIPDTKADAEIIKRVFPATAVQRGQFRDHRRTHKHAGIDLIGQCGSPIIASYSGVVLKAPGRDRGYGPIVRVVKGDDGIVYRYAHMKTTLIKPGQRVETGQQIGTMGKAGGSCHLHFEAMAFAEYRRKPYGVHSLDPNELLGGKRGAVMTAGLAMPGEIGSRVADRVRVRRAGR